MLIECTTSLYSTDLYIAKLNAIFYAKIWFGGKCGYADIRICGYANIRMYGYADMRIYGYADIRIYGY